MPPKPDLKHTLNSYDFYALFDKESRKKNLRYLVELTTNGDKIFPKSKLYIAFSFHQILISESESYSKKSCENLSLFLKNKKRIH